MRNLLKQGDFVVVYDPSFNRLFKGMVIQDEIENSQIYVSIIRDGVVFQNYYPNYLVIKI